MLCRKKEQNKRIRGMKDSLHASKEKRRVEVTEQNFVTKNKQKKPPKLASSEEVEKKKSIQEESKCRGEHSRKQLGPGLFL